VTDARFLVFDDGNENHTRRASVNNSMDAARETDVAREANG
jgi:hypothetical protein